MELGPFHTVTDLVLPVHVCILEVMRLNLIRILVTDVTLTILDIIFSRVLINRVCTVDALLSTRCV